jgi:ABC-type Fe3+ transport system substrate-binding protein
MERWNRRVLALMLVGLLGACAPAASRGGTTAPDAPGAPIAPAPAAASAPQAASSHSPEVQRLVEAARREGELVLVTSPTSFFDGGRNVGLFEEAFNTYYGLNTKLSWTPGPSQPEQVQRIVQAVQTGRTPPTDMLFAEVENTSALIDGNGAHAVPWQTMMPDLPALAVAEDGQAVAYGTKFYGITYSEQYVPPDLVPRTLEDVLHPRWKGIIASTPYATPYFSLALPTELGEATTTAFVERLSDHVGGLMRCGEHERLLSGEFVMLVMNCGSNSEIRAKLNGVPVNVAIPLDSVHLGYQYLSVTKNAKNVNTATLFGLFMLTPPGQALSYRSDLLDLHLLPGSQTHTMMEQMVAQGGRIMGENGIQDHRQYQQLIREYRAQYQRLLARHQ